jgi:L-rhamnose mutarotase
MCCTEAVKTFGLTLTLQDDPEKIAAYQRYHQAVWPQVTARLRECGVQRMQIFLRGRRLFMYLVTDDAFDPKSDFAHINDDPTSARWNALMAELQARAPEANEDEWWATMDLVFDLEWPQHR